MFVPKVGITGHRPQGFSNQSYVQDLCEQTVGYCMENFHNSEFNIGGCRGADSWVAKACIKHNCPFHLYLPFPVDIQAAAWSVEEREDLKCQTLDAKSVDVTSDRYGTRFYHIRDRKIVDNSHLFLGRQAQRRDV